MYAPLSDSTATYTLFRLRGVEPTAEGMLDSIPADQLDAIGADFRELDHLGVPAVALHGRYVKAEASWCADFSRITGLPVVCPSTRGAALVLLAIDSEVYALSYGDGYRLVPPSLKDRQFGLRFAIRGINPDDIRAAVARAPGLGRTDIAMLTAGAPIDALGLDTSSKLVQRLGGRLARPELTAGRAGAKRVHSVDGGAGLRLPFGADAAALVRDIREIAQICRDEAPRPRLEFVESVVSIRDRETVATLNMALDHALGTVDGARAAAAVPDECLSDFARARTIGIRFGSGEEWRSDAFDLDYVLGRLRFHRPGRRVTALHDGKVTLYRSQRARRDDILRTDPLARWVEVDLLLKRGRRFVLLENVWHEFDAAHLDGLSSAVGRLVTATPSVDLPPWREDQDEPAYNREVPHSRPGFVCMDTKLVRTPLHRAKGVEICDLLAPDNTLVMVKQARGSSDLSHLFSQGVVAVEALLHQADARAGFAERVAALGRGRLLPENFRPRRVVYAVRLKRRNAQLTPATLFPFAQVALVQAARTLESYGVRVEVVGIPTQPADAAGSEAA